MRDKRLLLVCDKCGAKKRTLWLTKDLRRLCNECLKEDESGREKGISNKAIR